jgi:hypothetical protein
MADDELGMGTGMITVKAGCDKDEADMLEDVESGAGVTIEVCCVNTEEELSTGGNITLLDAGSCEVDSDGDAGGVG